MDWLNASTHPVPIVLAQGPQAGGPANGNAAYEGGQRVGQITVYVMVAVVVLWGISKIFKKR